MCSSTAKTVVVNAIGDEVFLRGALFDAVDDRRRGVSTSTAVYSLVITATRNPALVLASGIMGTLFARQRRATGGIQAPTLTHVTWSMLMLRFLPRCSARWTEHAHKGVQVARRLGAVLADPAHRSLRPTRAPPGTLTLRAACSARPKWSSRVCRNRSMTHGSTLRAESP